MGELQCYFVEYPHWDTMLHTTSGFLAAAVGFSLVDLLNRDAKIKKLDAEVEEKNSQLEEKDNQLEEKNSQLNEQRNQLAMSVRMLHTNGLSAEQISMSLGMSEETVRKMLE